MHSNTRKSAFFCQQVASLCTRTVDFDKGSYRSTVILPYQVNINRYYVKGKREVPRGVRNSKDRRQDKFRRNWSRH